MGRPSRLAAAIADAASSCACEELEVLDRRRHHRQLAAARAGAGRRRGRTHALAIVSLSSCARRLLERCDGHEEAGVEAARRFADGRDPVADPHQIVDAQAQVVLCAQGAEVDVAVVDRLTVGEGRMAVGDHCSVGVGGQQNSRLFEALADRGDDVALVTVAVGRVDLAAGEDVHPAGERRRRRAAQHEDFDAARRVSRSSITVAAGLAGIGGSADAIAGDGNALRSVRPVLVWMDLEMTGLDPARHVIVEIATLVTDDESEHRRRGSRPRRPPRRRGAGRDGCRRRRDAHEERTCSTRSAASTISLADAGAQTLEFIKTHVTEARRVPLCGNSIGMDRRFLAAYLPEIEEYLHYRSVDVSTIKELVRRWYPALNSGRPRKAGAHRALDDVIESVAEMKFYREHVFVPEVAVPVAPVAAETSEPSAMESSPESS